MLRKAIFSSIHQEAKEEKVQVFLVLGLATVALGNISILGAIPVAARVYLPLALLVLLGCLLFNFKNAGGQLRYSLAVFFTFLFFIPGFLVTDLNPYGEKKFLAVLIALLLVVTPASSRVIRLNLLLLFKIIAGFSIITSVLLLIVGTPDVAGRATLWGLNPIGTGRVTGVGAVILFMFWVTRRVPLKRWWLYFLPIAICLFATTETGSRGPLFSVVLGILIPLLFGKQTVRSRVARFFITVIVGGAVAYISFSPSSDSGRITSLDANGRDLLYSSSLDVLISTPTGIGWGNFVNVLPNFPRVDSYTLYPHNIFLEIGVEGGWLALLSFALLLGLCVKNTISAINVGNKQAIIVLAVLIFSVINASLSSDFVGNRFMWLSLGLALVAFQENERSLRLVVDKIPGRQMNSGI